VGDVSTAGTSSESEGEIDNLLKELEEVKEGETTLLGPRVTTTRGPGSIDGPLFFNPAQALSRDITVLIVHSILRMHKGHRFSILDGLGGIGARGIRMAKEAIGRYEGDIDVKVTINDRSPVATELIRRNLSANDLREVTVTTQRLSHLLQEERFHYIDIDPFGPPIPFLDNALQSVYDHGFIAVTATDSAPLCGTYPKTCMRRYGARSLKNSNMHEIGLRILTGYCVRDGAKHDLALEPIFSFASDHYFRAFFSVRRGAKRADSCVNRLGYLNFKEGSLERKVSNDQEHGWSTAGPLWLGDLFSKELCDALDPDVFEFQWGNVERRLFETLINEVGAPPMFYTIDEICSHLKCSPPKMELVMDGLRSKGRSACRTHFSPTGIKTDATADEISALVSELSP